MIPASLTDIREQDGKVVLHKLLGMCETPPMLGERLVLTKIDGSVVTTGIIELIEWLGPATGNAVFNGKRRVVGSDCMFYTTSSAYRWKRVNESGQG